MRCIVALLVLVACMSAVGCATAILRKEVTPPTLSCGMTVQELRELLRSKPTAQSLLDMLQAGKVSGSIVVEDSRPGQPMYVSDRISDGTTLQVKFRSMWEQVKPIEVIIVHSKGQIIENLLKGHP